MFCAQALWHLPSNRQDAVNLISLLIYNTESMAAR